MKKSLGSFLLATGAVVSCNNKRNKIETMILMLKRKFIKEL